MEPNLLTSLTEAELRERQKKNRRNNPWITLLLAYRNPRKARGVNELLRAKDELSAPYDTIAALLCFYRLVENKKEEEAAILGKTLENCIDPMDQASIHAFLVHWGKEEPQTDFERIWSDVMDHRCSLSQLLSINPYLYYLLALGDFPKSESLAFYPRNGAYSRARFWMAFLAYGKTRQEWAKWYSSYREKTISIREFLSLPERELLSLLQRNPFVEVEDYLNWKMFSGRYPALKTLHPSERQIVLDHLVARGAISSEDGILTLCDGGFFFLACSNRAS